MALDDDITVLDDGTRIYRGETKDRMLDEALAMALETECKPLYPDTPIERMYDAYFSYDCTIMTLEMGEYPLCEFIKDKEGRKLRGAKLVQYVFSLHGTEISPEQADAFVPFLYQETLANVGDGTDDEPDNQFDIDVKTLFESQDFWENIKAMYDYYTAIEPHLLQELDKMHDLHPETNEDKWVTLNDLKALLFVYNDFPDEELEPFFEKCRSGNPRQVFMQRKMPLVYFYHQYFKYIYTAVKAARQAVSKELEPIKEEPLRQNLIPKVNPYLPDCFFIMKDIVTKKLMFDRDYKYDKKTRLKAANEDKVANGIYKTMPYITILVSWKDDKSIMQPITGFDRELYFRVCNLYYEGQDYLTFNQIARAMGYKSNVGKVYREKIINSLLKLATTWVLIDNTEETKVFKDYEPVKKYAPYLTFSFDECYVKGQLTHGIRIHDDPHLFLFGYERGHFATVPIEALQCEISMNDTLSDIRYYLLSHISWLNNLAAKHQPYHKTLKLDTIWENCHITTSRQQKTQKEKLKYILEPMKTSRFIKDYEIDDECITITANKEYASEKSLTPKRKNK